MSITAFFHPFFTLIKYCKQRKDGFREVGHEVPGVVAVLCKGMGGVGEVKYGLIAAARSAFTC